MTEEQRLKAELDDAIALIMILLDREGGEVTITDEEIVNVNRHNRNVYRFEHPQIGTLRLKVTPRAE